MLTLEELASEYFETNIPLEITPEEGVASQESFQQSKVCWMCENPLGDGEATREATQIVRDHDHLIGKYRGAAHNRCNLNCKKRQIHLFPYFSTILVVMIVISYLKNS